MLPACWVQFKLRGVVEVLGLLSFAPKLENIILYSQPSWNHLAGLIGSHSSIVPQELTQSAPHTVCLHLLICPLLTGCSYAHLLTIPQLALAELSSQAI